MLPTPTAAGWLLGSRGQHTCSLKAALQTWVLRKGMVFVRAPSFGHRWLEMWLDPICCSEARVRT